MDTTPSSQRPPIELQQREQWIRHDGQVVLFHDYSNLDGDKAVGLVLWLSEQIIRRGIHDILILTDVTGARGTKKAISAFKKATSQNKPYVKKSAVIGIQGLAKVFFQTVVMFSGIENRTRMFDAKQEALDWLVK